MINGYVTSYTNPDTDGVCCGLAVCMYKEKMGLNYRLYINGEISSETKLILSKFCFDKYIVNEFNECNDIIIVDTHNISQMPHLTKLENVSLIIDHHDDGNLLLFPNAEIINMKVGAAASILFDIIDKQGLIDEKIAFILGTAIISNTLNFCNPSTTDFDKEILTKIKRIVEIDDELICNMFQSRNELLNLTEEQIIEYDMKKFVFSNTTILISQVEILDTTILLEDKNFQNAMHRYSKNDVLLILNIIDILNKKSILIVYDERILSILNKIFNFECNIGINNISRILLRKTDFIPKLNEFFKEIK